MPVVSVRSRVGRFDVESTTAINIHPGEAIDGLDVQITLAEGQRVRALVPRQVFEERFKASDEPAAWMAAYRENAVATEAVVERRHDDDPKATTIILRESDF